MTALPPKLWQRRNDAVFYTDVGLAALDSAAISFLQELLPKSPQQRVRVCTHSDVQSPFQEMMIALGKQGYVRPHRHHGKIESVHAIAGRAVLMLFDESGRVSRQIPLGPEPNDCWYFRIDRPVFHTLLPQTDAFVFHESTTGPFREEDTEFAAWAPEERDADAARRYVAELQTRVDPGADMF